MSRIGPSNYHIACRKHLFKEQVARFRRCMYRQPTYNEIRQMCRETCFKTA